ncbi:uncharacterized protein LY79DRAFT_256726 [Colletotrichum navitas]|uniref:Uncharacterized protein n=1 Tax=Colletotrichum navitas TaxID=681940 RepID=A0AAD8V908_9PEZI|nr:uncharacterized protein LY79DRAFT_256726 [Colletotrichum navitas]KAK1598787.1 hypothetical protein LY79DRAFT_256726 [Colletotrichum navitas]
MLPPFTGPHVASSWLCVQHSKSAPARSPAALLTLPVPRRQAPHGLTPVPLVLDFVPVPVPVTVPAPGRPVPTRRICYPSRELLVQARAGSHVNQAPLILPSSVLSSNTTDKIGAQTPTACHQQATEDKSSRSRPVCQEPITGQGRDKQRTRWHPGSKNQPG